MQKTNLINCKYLTLTGLLVFVVGCIGCDINFGSFTKVKSERTERLSAPIVEGSTLTAATQVGSITVTGADTTECDITAKITAGAPTQEEADELAGHVKIELAPDDDGLLLEIEKPVHESRRTISIDLDITVPVQTNLRLESDVGEIKVSNINGSVTANTDVGAINCTQVTGNVQLITDVGEVTCEYSDTAESAFSATLETDVGRIRFAGPANLSAKVDASTNIGSIETSLPLTITGRLIERQIRGTIGEGTATVKLKANVGSIKIE